MICFEHELSLPKEMGIPIWTARGPKVDIDSQRDRKVIYKLFEPGSSFSEVATVFEQFIDGIDDWLGELTISQENQAENMPVFELAGTITKY